MDEKSKKFLDKEKQQQKSNNERSINEASFDTKSKSGIPKGLSSSDRSNHLLMAAYFRSNQLKKISELVGLSVNDLAKLVQVDPTTFNRYLKGSICPNFSILKFLCAQLLSRHGWVISLEWLLTDIFGYKEEDLNSDVLETKNASAVKTPFKISDKEQCSKVNTDYLTGEMYDYKDGDFFKKEPVTNFNIRDAFDDKNNYMTEVVYQFCHDSSERFPVLLKDNNIPIAKAGDVLVCEKIKISDLKNGEYCCVSINGGEFFIGKVQISDKDFTNFFLVNNSVVKKIDLVNFLVNPTDEELMNRVDLTGIPSIKNVLIIGRVILLALCK